MHYTCVRGPTVLTGFRTTILKGKFTTEEYLGCLCLPRENSRKIVFVFFLGALVIKARSKSIAALNLYQYIPTVVIAVACFFLESKPSFDNDHESDFFHLYVNFKINHVGMSEKWI